MCELSLESHPRRDAAPWVFQLKRGCELEDQRGGRQVCGHRLAGGVLPLSRKSDPVLRRAQRLMQLDQVLWSIHMPVLGPSSQRLPFAAIRPSSTRRSIHQAAASGDRSGAAPRCTRLARLMSAHTATSRLQNATIPMPTRRTVPLARTSACLVLRPLPIGSPPMQ